MAALTLLPTGAVLHSGWASGASIYNRVLAERPDLLEVGHKRQAIMGALCLHVCTHFMGPQIESHTVSKGTQASAAWLVGQMQPAAAWHVTLLAGADQAGALHALRRNQQGGEAILRAASDQFLPGTLPGGAGW